MGPVRKDEIIRTVAVEVRRLIPPNDAARRDRVDHFLRNYVHIAGGLIMFTYEQAAATARTMATRAMYFGGAIATRPIARP